MFVSFSEWLVNQHRDSAASYIGHYNLLDYFALVENESRARTKFNLLEVVCWIILTETCILPVIFLMLFVWKLNELEIVFTYLFCYLCDFSRCPISRGVLLNYNFLPFILYARLPVTLTVSFHLEIGSMQKVKNRLWNKKEEKTCSANILFLCHILYSVNWEILP